MIIFVCYFCNMYIDTNRQREVQKATGKHTTDNGNSDEQLDGNRLAGRLCNTGYSPTHVLQKNVRLQGLQHPYEQGQISTLLKQKELGVIIIKQG